MEILFHFVAMQGYALRPALLELGLRDRDLWRGIHSQLLHRIRPGAYTTKEYWNSLDSVERHLLTAKAVLAQTPGDAALCGVSALAAHGVALWGHDLSKVHIVRPARGHARVEAGVVHHKSGIAGSDIVDSMGIPVTSVARAVLESVASGGLEGGLVAADSALHRRLTTPEELNAMYERVEGWPGMRPGRLVIRLADGGAETPGETRSRFLCYRHNIPCPTLQFPVFDENGELVGTSDMAWPDAKLLGEFDGRVKYGRLLKPGQSVSDVVFAEKRREDRMRELTGFKMIRMTWSDIDKEPLATAARIRRMLYGNAA